MFFHILCCCEFFHMMRDVKFSTLLSLLDFSTLCFICVFPHWVCFCAIVSTVGVHFNIECLCCQGKTHINIQQISICNISVTQEIFICFQGFFLTLPKLLAILSLALIRSGRSCVENARVVELADSLDSGSSVQYGRGGSSPPSRTK